MLNFLLWSAIFALSTSIFSFTYSLGGISRTFESLSVSLLQETVKAMGVEVPSGGGLAPYFSEALVKRRVGDFFVENLKDYATASFWSLSYAFSSFQSEITSLNGIVAYFYPQKVRISFSCSYLQAYEYSNSRSFVVAKGDLYDE